jgi:hypothetical protein
VLRGLLPTWLDLFRYLEAALSLGIQTVNRLRRINRAERMSRSNVAAIVITQGIMLRVIHPQIGCNAEGFHFGCIFRENGDSHAGANVYGMFAAFEGLVEEFDQRLANECCICAAGRFFQNDRELIAAGSGYCVRSAHAGGKHFADLLQD